MGRGGEGRGGEGRGGEGRGGEGRGGEGRGGEGGVEGERREGRDDYYTYYSDGTIYNEELYLYNNDVTYYVITFKSAFD